MKIGLVVALSSALILSSSTKSNLVLPSEKIDYNQLVKDVLQSCSPGKNNSNIHPLSIKTTVTQYFSPLIGKSLLIYFGGIIKDPEVSQRIDKIMKKLLDILEENPKRWELLYLLLCNKIAETDYKRRIYLSIGTVALQNLTDAEIAHLIGHEIGHTILNHGPWSNFIESLHLKREKEADTFGIQLVQKAGYPPKAALSLAKKFFTSPDGTISQYGKEKIKWITSMVNSW